MWCSEHGGRQGSMLGGREWKMWRKCRQRKPNHCWPSLTAREQAEENVRLESERERRNNEIACSQKRHRGFGVRSSLRNEGGERAARACMRAERLETQSEKRRGSKRVRCLHVCRLCLASASGGITSERGQPTQGARGLLVASTNGWSPEGCVTTTHPGQDLGALTTAEHVGPQAASPCSGRSSPNGGAAEMRGDKDDKADLTRVDRDDSRREDEARASKPLASHQGPALPGFVCVFTSGSFLLVGV